MNSTCLNRIKLINHSNIAVVLVHEIYGINNHIEYKSNDLFEKGFDVYCENLLNRPSFGYDEEKEAYHYFYREVGLQRAYEQTFTLVKSLKRSYQKVVIWGYSVGATIAWMCSEDGEFLDAVVGFYGSRIRDYSRLHPRVPVLLFYPYEETSFDVKTLVDILNKKDKVKVDLFSGEHGFANPFSKKYDAGGEKESLAITLKFLEIWRDEYGI
ncbi:dienelactone hydrolase family protein [Bacillus carboniphilus]|uniref:Dienelactone hydrolase family protein n=1 Tax=Bacillus carboniphilus TaxID=86663 RepID=A0ABY9JTP7_9BACI|nr:dienelactone hydrolase family protein [Bacillus carboniphilus]WLR42732.1 dienelactone hydrolase family protein [Bacillus carboniphilus]